MPYDRIANSVRRLASPTLVRWGAVNASLVLAQRLVGSAAAWTIFGSGTARFAVPAALSVLFALGSFAQRLGGALAEGDLFERTAAAVLGGDVLGREVLPDEDARTELVQAVYSASLAVTQTLPSLLADCVAAVVLTTVLIRLEPFRVVAMGGGVALAMSAALLFSRRRAARAEAGAWNLQRRVFEAAVDILEGRLEIVASGHTDDALADLRERTTAWGRAGRALATSAALSGRLPLALIAGLVATVLATGDHLHALSIGTLRDVALCASVVPAFAGIAQGLNTWWGLERWVSVVVRMLAAARPRARGKRTPVRLPVRVEMARLSFDYVGSDGGRTALREVDWGWDGRGAVALAGPNGSGKSTWLRLLVRLAEPRSGVIRVGGMELSGFDADAWRSRIAFVPQRPYFPARVTVRDAIRWLVPAASDAAIAAALDRVGLVDSSRRGGRRLLDVSVDTLSVGQKQRVALARVLCRDADLYLLDEPDANLDRDGIQRCAAIVSELARDRGVIFAAHSTELLAVADHVVSLDDGRLVGTATYFGEPDDARLRRGGAG